MAKVRITVGGARLVRGGLVGLMLLALAACSPVIRYHGYAPDETELALVEVGQDTRDTVVEKIGRPGASGLLEDSAWYYVQSRREHTGWRAPAEVSREVVSINFDVQGRVENVERFGLERGEVVTLSRRVTKSNVPPPSIISQLLRNVGVFNPRQFFN
jgi:outer membrane protein assembly factor BamE (lipoprotein component of BamABCDE complex)